MQGDLFNPPTSTPSPNVAKKIEMNWKMVALSLFCPICKREYSISAHPAIHTFEWMDQHWGKIEEGVYKVVGPCGRQCNLKSER
jgi:hypothetical protein